MHPLLAHAGNTCRSPIAEAVFIDEVKRAAAKDKWEVDSAALAPWHVGNGPNARSLAIMSKYNLAYDNKARQVCSPPTLHEQRKSQRFSQHFCHRSKRLIFTNSTTYLAWTMTTCTSYTIWHREMEKRTFCCCAISIQRVSKRFTIHIAWVCHWPSPRSKHNTLEVFIRNDFHRTPIQTVSKNVTR